MISAADNDQSDELSGSATTTNSDVNRRECTLTSLCSRSIAAAGFAVGWAVCWRVENAWRGKPEKTSSTFDKSVQSRRARRARVAIDARRIAILDPRD